MLAGMLAGCQPEKQKDSPFAIYNSYENMQVDIGDKRDYVIKLLGKEEKYITDFEEDNIERVEYWDTEDVSVDYDMATWLVIGIRASNAEWSLFNGLKVGDSIDTVMGQYPENMVHVSQGNNLYISYDNDGNIIEYSEESPYFVRFEITDGKVASIWVMNNAAYPVY